MKFNNVEKLIELGYHPVLIDDCIEWHRGNAVRSISHVEKDRVKGEVVVLIDDQVIERY